MAAPGITAPSITLPKGGGGIRGVGEKFAANPVTGTGSMVVPIFTSPGRSKFNPQLSLSYDSGSGNGPFFRVRLESVRSSRKPSRLSPLRQSLPPVRTAFGVVSRIISVRMRSAYIRRAVSGVSRWEA